MRYQKQGPSPLLVILIAAAIVFGGYFLYIGAVNWYENDAIGNRTATSEGELTQTSESIANATQAFMPFPTNTKVPNCQIYFVDVSSAFVRECPSLTCRGKANKPQQSDVCVIGRPDPAEFPIYQTVNEWWVIDLNEGYLYPDLGYMHESVLAPRNPTPRPSQTFTPLPTITPFPTGLLTITPLPGQTITPQSDGDVEF